MAAVLLVLIVCVLAASPADAETLGYLDNTIGVFDSLGRKVADYEWNDSGFGEPDWLLQATFATGPGATFTVGVTPDGWSPPNLYFFSSTCSGGPLVRGWGNAVAGERDSVYVGTGERRAAQVWSMRSGRSSVCQSFTRGLLGVWETATPLIDLRDWFEPPFSLRYRGTAVPR